MICMKWTRGLAAVFLAAGLVSGVALAQSSTQGAIAGTVEDATNAVIPSAKVTIRNIATNAEQSVTSDSSGYFKVPLLEPGIYKVTISAPNFGIVDENNVIVQVGQLTTLEPHLAVGGSTEVVEVSAAAPILNFESPDFSANLNKEALENIPINNRRWSSLAMTTPGVVDNGSGFGLVSVRGINGILNSVLIDGADDNQAYYSEERGRTREAYSTSGSAVREFAVNTGVYSAEYGRAAGGVINSVTNSGTNQLHGEAYFYDRESKWNAFNDFSRLTTPTLVGGVETFPSAPLKPKDLRKIYGFTVGGPIIKDKLFFTYTYDQHTRIFPGQGIPNNAATFYTLPNAAPATGAVCNTSTGLLTGDTNALDQQVCTLAARTTPLAANPYASAYALYTADIVGLTSDLGTVPRIGDQEINTAKLTYQLNPKENIEVLYHRLRWDSPGGVQTSAALDYGLDTWGNDFIKLDYGLTKLTSILSSRMTNELLYQYSRELDDESQQPFSAYTLANLVGTGGNIPEILLDTSVFGMIGSPYYSYRKALPDERKWQIGDVLHYEKGNHGFTFGGDVLNNYDLLNNLFRSNGYESYSFLGNYMADLYHHLNGGTGDTCNSTALATASVNATTGVVTSAVGTDPCYSSLSLGLGASPEFAISTLDYSFFAQDNWKVTPRLTLELGARYDNEILPAPSAALTAAATGYTPFPGANNHPNDKNNVGARIGFADDVFGTGKTVVRGGYGMFYGRITNAILLNVELNTGSPLGQYLTTYTPSTANAPTFPNITNVGSAPTPSAYYLASNLQNPDVQEFDLVVQQELGKGSVFSVSYLGALGRHLTNFLDLNLDPTTMTSQTITVTDANSTSNASAVGPLGPTGTVYHVPTYTKYGNTAQFGTVAPSYQNITQVTSNINSSYNALVFEIQNRSIHNLQFDFNYTWSHALDFNQNGQTTDEAEGWYDPYGSAQANYGNSAFNVPNRLVGYVLYKFPELKGQSWYTYLSNGWSVDDTYQAQSGLPYTTTLTGSTTAAAFGGSLWNGAGGLGIVPGIIAPDTNKLPRHQVDDARLSKNFKFAEKYNLALFAQVFNVANHQNYDGVSSTAYKLSGAGVTYQTALQAGTTPFGTLTSSNNSGFLYTPRQIEIAAKFTF
jgi:hypothetical protein